MLNWDWARVKNLRTFYRWLLSYVAIVGVISAASSYFLFSKTSGLVNQKIDDAQKNVVANYSAIIDKSIENVRNIAVKYINTRWTMKAMHINQNLREIFDVVELKDYYNELIYYKSTDKLIFSIAIIFPFSNNAMSSFSGTQSMNEWFENIGCSQEDYTMIVNEFTQLNYMKILQPITISPGNVSYEVIPVIQSLDFPSDMPKGDVLVFLSVDWMNKLLAKNASQTGRRGFLLFDTGEMIGETGTGDLDREGMLDMAESTDGSVLSYEKDGNYYYFVPSGIAPWKYVYVYPKASITGEFDQNRLSVITFSAVIFLTGISLSVFFTVRNYHPLNLLIKRIKEITSSGPDAKKASQKTEYQIMESSVNKLYQDKKLVEIKVMQYKPLVKSHSLIRLVQGDFMFDDEAKSLLRESELDDGPGTCYCVLMVQSADCDPVPQDDAGETQNNRNILIAKMLRMVISEEALRAEVFHSGKNRTAVIACLDSSGKTAVDTVKKVVFEMRETIRGETGLDVYIGYGEIYNKPADICKSYHKAIEMLEWVLFTRDESGASIERFLNSVGLQYFYPYDWEERFINNLKRGNREVVEKIIRELKYENLVNKSLQFSVIKRLLLRIIDTEFRVIGEIGLSDRSDAGISEDIFLSGNVNDLWSYIEVLYTKVCNAITEGPKAKLHSDFEEVFLAYLNEYFKDPNLSLKNLSDRFNLSISSVSLLVKKLTGSNFIDYITRKRIDLAKDLLVANGDSIQSVSRKVGYECDKSFRRTFKKYEGISPSEYRYINQAGA